jgi:CHASE2 domain-containing sensor protein
MTNTNRRALTRKQTDWLKSIGVSLVCVGQLDCIIAQFASEPAMALIVAGLGVAACMAGCRVLAMTRGYSSPWFALFGFSQAAGAIFVTRCLPDKNSARQENTAAA